MQYWQGYGLGAKSECWYGDSSLTFDKATTLGPSTNCAKGTDGNMYGGPMVNALYATY